MEPSLCGNSVPKIWFTSSVLGSLVGFLGLLLGVSHYVHHKVGAVVQFGDGHVLDVVAAQRVGAVAF